MLIETSAWIEMFKGTSLGKKVQDIINSRPCQTSMVSLAEIARWGEANGADVENLIITIEQTTTILQLKREIVIEAGKLTAQRKKQIHNWGLVDALIYFTANSYGLIILTTDHHFVGLPNVELLEES